MSMSSLKTEEKTERQCGQFSFRWGLSVNSRSVKPFTDHRRHQPAKHVMIASAVDIDSVHDEALDTKSSLALGSEHDFDGEFDPGSGRTLAACLTHASRTRSIRS